MKMVLVNNCNKPVAFNSFRVEAGETVVVDYALIKGDKKIRNSIRSKEVSMYVVTAPKVSGIVNKCRLITDAVLDPSRKTKQAVPVKEEDPDTTEKEKAKKAEIDKINADKAAAEEEAKKQAAADKKKEEERQKDEADKADKGGHKDQKVQDAQTVKKEQAAKSSNTSTVKTSAGAKANQSKKPEGDKPAAQKDGGQSDEVKNKVTRVRNRSTAKTDTGSSDLM